MQWDILREAARLRKQHAVASAEADLALASRYLGARIPGLPVDYWDRLKREREMEIARLHRAPLARFYLRPGPVCPTCQSVGFALDDHGQRIVCPTCGMGEK